jgi:hypothetical protein
MNGAAKCPPQIAAEKADGGRKPRKPCTYDHDSFHLSPHSVIHAAPLSNCRSIRQRDSLGEFVTRPWFGYLGSRRPRFGAPVFFGAQHPPLPGLSHRRESPG